MAETIENTVNGKVIEAAYSGGTDQAVFPIMIVYIKP